MVMRFGSMAPRAFQVMRLTKALVGELISILLEERYPALLSWQERGNQAKVAEKSSQLGNLITTRRAPAVS